VPKNISGCCAVFIGGSAFAHSGGSPEIEFNRVWKIRNSAWLDRPNFPARVGNKVLSFKFLEFFARRGIPH